MDEVLLIRISLVVIIVGLLFLFFIDVPSFDSKNLDRDRKIQGRIEVMNKYNSSISLEVLTTCKEKVIVFDKYLSLKVGDYVEVYGTSEGDTIFATEVFLLK